MGCPQRCFSPYRSFQALTPPARPASQAGSFFYALMGLTSLTIMLSHSLSRK